MDQGRFGEFVSEIIKAENERRKETEEKENEQKLWELYLHSYSDKSFVDWKSEIQTKTNEQKTKDENMTEDDIVNIINELFPPGNTR